MRLTVDVTQEEAIEVKEKAQAAGLPVLAYMRRALGLQWERRQGRPVVLRQCPYGCRGQYSARELRDHLVRCEARGAAD